MAIDQAATVDAYRARLERLGAWTTRDQSNEVYRRVVMAARLRDKLKADRQYRAMDRTRRESEAIKRQSNERVRRRDEAYSTRLRAIIDRVVAERKIKPPGKGLKSHWRYQNQIAVALRSCDEYRDLQERRTRANERIDRIRSRRGIEQIMASVLAIDDRTTRHAKVKAYREGQEAHRGH